MHVRRLACLLLGIWLGGSLFMDVIAGQNFRSVDALLEEPTQGLQESIQRLGGPSAARLLLRHQVSELNRFYFEHWELIQLLIGAILFGLLLFGTHEGKLVLSLCLAMIMVVMATHWLVTPSIVSLGRGLDFVAPDGQPLLRQQMLSRHFLYTSLEVFKLVVGGVLAGFLIWSNTRKRTRREEETETTARFGRAR